MSLNVAQLCERVAARFSDVEQVDDWIIRSTRKVGERPFSIYYFDIENNVPQTLEALTHYQDRVVGRRYFEGKKSLQWSNYLYFVMSRDCLASGPVRAVKDLIERDRSYARKFVIAEEELDTVLFPPVVTPVDATLRTNILTVWTDSLVEAGLDRAVLSDDDLPTRLKLIEASSIQAPAQPRAWQSNMSAKGTPFLHSLQLKKFRDFPRQRSFQFGTVNLIVGANGSGKTSLLEAIELFYCGRNKRNPDVRHSYELSAVLADDRPETVTANRPLQALRDRNLAWYGVSEVNTTKLYLSFAQFNFLDTDAAVSLADSTSHLEEDLSKLLVGADAAKAWRNIERVHDAVASKLRELRPLEEQIKNELTILNERTMDTSGIAQESDAMRRHLEAMLSRVGWLGTQRGKDTLVSRLVGMLSELVSLAQQAAACDWIMAPVSLDGIATYCREARITSARLETDIARLAVIQQSQTRAADALQRNREVWALLQLVDELIDSGMHELVAEQSAQQRTVATAAGWLAGLDTEDLSVLVTDDLALSVAAWCQAAAAKRTAAEVLLTNTQNDYANFRRLQDQSLHLAQELRQIAAKILQSSHKPDECPLCHTSFAPGALARHIHLGVDENLEVLGQTLLTQVQEREESLRNAASVEAVSNWLAMFCARAGIATESAVRVALTKVDEVKHTLAEGQRRLEVLNSTIQAREAEGFSMARLVELSAQLREHGSPLAALSREATDQLRTRVAQEATEISQSHEAQRQQAEALQQTLAAMLGVAHTGMQALKSAFARLKERLAATERLHVKLREFAASFPWSGERPLAALTVEAEALRTVATDLQAALGRERQAQATHAASIKRQEDLQGQLTVLQPRIKRLTEAQVTLEKLQKDYSLTQAMEAVLRHNRVGIETIFSRLHAPAEFRGLGSNWTTLVRKDDDSEAKLSEISTGQRAAFALSLFLAQNAQLTVAPPVVLIDDPIAHVDDLNALSFLDYLREMVLKGGRQIFFATANNKLATLFERKFDFLGAEGFRRFDLRRETVSVT